MLFDTHAHYDDSRFDGDRHEIITSLKGAGISLVLNVGADLPDSVFSRDLAEKYDFIYASAGIHPHYANEITNEDLEAVKKLFECKKVKALGEIGLDYHYDNLIIENQKKWFAMQLDLARELDVPVIVHERDACADVLDIIKNYPDLKMVFHCYSGSLETAKYLINRGIYISFTGVITFKNAKKMPEIVKYVPDDMIMIETDCPYLSPEPYRGQRNSSLFLHKTAEKAAEIKGWSFEECCEITRKNGCAFFGINV